MIYLSMYASIINIYEISFAYLLQLWHHLNFTIMPSSELVHFPVQFLDMMTLYFQLYYLSGLLICPKCKGNLFNFLSGDQEFLQLKGHMMLTKVVL